MRPPRILAAPVIAVLSLVFAAVLLAPTFASAAVPRRKAPPILEEKQRVPKEKPREKPATGTTSTGTSSSSDSDSDSDCAASCLPSLFEGSSTSSGAETLAPAPRGWAVYDHGWLRAKTPGDSLMLFEGPVEAGRSDVPVGALPDGQEVVVEELHALPSGLELRVRPADRLAPFGWIASDVVSTTKPTPSPAARAAGPPASAWSVQLAVGGGGPVNTELDEEYPDGGFHIEGHYQNHSVGIPTAQWMWAVGAGYWDHKGNPVVKYVDTNDPARSEVPSSSTLRLASLSLEGGGRLGTDRGFRFTGALGPALFYLNESALVRTVVDSTGAVVDTRTETLGRWTGGGIARLAFGWRFPGGFEIAAQIDGYAMAWNAREEKSLTTDFIKNEIGGVGVAVAFTYPAP